MNNNSCFGDINNCNSLNISVVSPTTVNSIRRNSFYKLTNVLLLLFLLFGSCGVSFGMKKKNNPVPIAPRDIYLRVPSMINGISMLFLTKVMSVKKENIKDKLDKGTRLVDWLSWLGPNEYYDTYYRRTNRVALLVVYAIGVGNVPYVGGLFNFSLVCKPTKYLPTFLKDKVTIHLIDLKPFNFILGCVFSTWLIWYTKCKKLYIRPHWIVGFCTVEIQIAKYYNISLNFGSWILDLIAFMKYTKVNEIIGSL